MPGAPESQTGSQPLSRSATRPLSRSATQPLSHSATQQPRRSFAHSLSRSAAKPLVLGCVVLLSVLGSSEAALSCTQSNFMSLLSQHATANDCWTIITTNSQLVIYDITKLVRNHDGGSAVVEQLCGVDGSIGFYCVHSKEELQESIDDGDASAVCTVSGVRRRALHAGGGYSLRDDDDTDDEGEDEDDIQNNCAAGGTLPTPPATSIAATTVESHSTSNDCWTALDGIVFDMTKYMHLHPGGSATVLSMCGKDSSAPYKAQHSLNYITQGVTAGWITTLGSLTGAFTQPEVPSSSSAGLATIDRATLESHSSDADCWIQVSDFVYDVTAFASTHPSGKSWACGKDETAIFNLQHPTTYLGRMNDMLKGKIGTSSLSQTSSPDLPTNASTPIFLIQEVQQHNTETDCWVVLHCEVLDVTNFLPRHTGESQYGTVGAIKPLCGRDSSNEFDMVNHPGSYRDLSIAMGAVSKGVLSGCTDASDMISVMQQTGTSTLAGSAQYQIRFAGITDPATHIAAGDVTKAAIADQLHQKMSATGHSNLQVKVVNLTVGSLIAHVQFEFSNYKNFGTVKSFAMHPSGLGAVTFQNQAASVIAGPALQVSVVPKAVQKPLNATVSQDTLNKQYTMLQVADHKTENDCWLVVHGMVWNCANGGSLHSGGSHFKRGYCGIDSSREFDAVHGRTYNTVPEMKKSGCSLIGTVSSEQGAKAEAQVRASVLPPLMVSLNGGGQKALADHASESNCWMAIRGTVYSAGTLLQDHEGGLRQVKALCGIDATAGFDCVHDTEELEEGEQDYGMQKVGTVDQQLGRRCTWEEPTDLGTVDGAMVAQHSTSGDCWSVIDGLVWDLTPFVLHHTGGSSSIVAICGADGTASFTKHHKIGYLSTMRAKGLKIMGKLISPIPAPEIGSANYPAVASSEMAKHSTRSSCWTAIHGYVMDITGFMDTHTGGASTLTPSCGKDGTAEFEAGGHPQSYVSLMVQKQYGILKGCLDKPCGGDALTGSSAATTLLQPEAGKTATFAARECTPNEPQNPNPEVPMDEVAKHNQPSDCWMVLGCGVYDVTNYKHSAGDGLVHQNCGRDGTSSFTSQHPMSYLQVMLTKGAVLVGKAAAVSVDNTVTRQTPISVTDLMKHSSPDDCWSCIGGNVYDLTFFLGSHEAGDAVVLPMCGFDGTLALLKAHSMDVMSGLLIVGSCNRRAEKAFTEQEILDAAAFVAYVILPFILIGIAHNCLTIRQQDQWLRRPIAPPQKGQWGDFINGYLEMPLALVCLLGLYFVITAVLYWFWIKHYDEYYPDLYSLPGAAGRMSVYHMCLATFIGTRRFTWSWWLLRLPYERALKTHYVVGFTAGVLALLHGFAYIDAYEFKLPETVGGTAIPMVICLCIFLPFTFPNLRVKFYGIFRITHYLAPAVMILTVLHILALNADGILPRGFHVTVFWVATATGFWVLDFLQTLWDSFAYPTILDGAPVLLPSSGDAAYIAVIVKKKTAVYPGCWMSVACPQAFSGLSHPFTTIVRHDGQSDGDYATLEFVWKVNKGKWTDKIYQAIENGEQNLKLVVAGPFGGGLGAFVNLNKIKAMVFVCAGVGVTPVASMLDMFGSDSRRFVHVVWSFRSMGLFEYLNHHFNKLPEKNCHFHFTSKDHPTDFGAKVKSGRPKLPEILEDVRTQCAERSMTDIGVFVCGPNPMVCDVLEVTRRMNLEAPPNADGLRSYFHVHSESFQM